jgi:hypothetical protein
MIKHPNFAMTSDEALQFAHQVSLLPTTDNLFELLDAAIDAVAQERRYMPRDWKIGQAAEDLLRALRGHPNPFTL